MVFHIKEQNNEIPNIVDSNPLIRFMAQSQGKS